jgi:hypothetical protein
VIVGVSPIGLARPSMWTVIRCTSTMLSVAQGAHDRGARPIGLNRTACPLGTRGLQRYLITAVLIRLADEGARVGLALLIMKRTKRAAVGCLRSRCYSCRKESKHPPLVRMGAPR